MPVIFYRFKVLVSLRGQFDNTIGPIGGAGPTGLTLACELPRRNISGSSNARLNAAFDGKVKAYLLNDVQAIQRFHHIPGWFVIRPDGYIGMIAGINDQAAVEQYLAQLTYGAK